MDSSKQISHNIKAGAGRIAKHMARAGVCSRRDAERLIADKRVTLNGAIVESPAVNVTDADVICVDGRRVAEPEKARLWRYHKMKGQVTTAHDPQGRETVFDRLPADLPRLIAIGRLDFNTEGLLLFTNDGALSRHLELPSTGWLRRYRVRVNGRPKADALAALSNGIEIEGVRYGAIEARMDGREQAGANTWLTIGIREGKNREVRKVMDHLGLQVTRLIRVSFGPFALGEMPPGEIEEVKTRVLAEQLGAALAEEFGLKAAADRAALRPEPRMHRTGFRADASGDASKRRPDSGAKRSGAAMRGAKPGGERAGNRGAASARPQRPVTRCDDAPAVESRPARADVRPEPARRSFAMRERANDALVKRADQAGEKKPWARERDDAGKRERNDGETRSGSSERPPRRPASRDGAPSTDTRPSFAPRKPRDASSPRDRSTSANAPSRAGGERPPRGAPVGKNFGAKRPSFEAGAKSAPDSARGEARPPRKPREGGSAPEARGDRKPRSDGARPPRSFAGRGKPGGASGARTGRPSGGRPPRQF